MKEVFLNRFTDEDVREIMIDNWKEFKMQTVDLGVLKKPVKEQIAILKKLRKDVSADTNNPMLNQLLEMIDNKIKNLMEMI